MTHRVGLIRFDVGTNDGVMQCRCGWFGRVSDYDVHRGAVQRDPDTCRSGLHRDDFETYRLADGTETRRCRACHRESMRRARDRKRAQRERAVVAA